MAAPAHPYVPLVWLSALCLAISTPAQIQAQSKPQSKPPGQLRDQTPSQDSPQETGTATGEDPEEVKLPEPSPRIPMQTDMLFLSRPVEGVLALQSGYRNHPYIDADAQLWLGAGETTGSNSDILSASLGFRDPYGISRGRAGRFLLSTGAVRPVQLDGGTVTLRAPTGTTAQVFGGMPVVPEFGERDHDWMAGGRVGQWLWQERLGMGISYVHRRDAGMIAYEELGGDVSLMPLPWLSISALAGVNLTRSALADGRIRVGIQKEPVHAEVFASRRVAALLLPATSLFSVVSDGASSELGTDLTWFAFPRLDLGTTLSVLSVDSSVGYQIVLRSTLRLDEEGAGDIYLEANRRRVNGAGYTGGRIASRVPLSPALFAHASVELVGADNPGEKGTLWPWMRAGATYSFSPNWQAGGALEVRASPQYKSETLVLARLSYQAEARP